MTKERMWLFVKSKPWCTTSSETISADLAQVERDGINTRGATLYYVDEYGEQHTVDAKKYARSQQKRHRWWWNRD